MNKTKNVLIFAALGFVLSFIIGLVSSVSFGFILLRAVISAAVFVGIYYGAVFIFDKFLSEDASVNDFTGSISGGSSKGQNVDINIDEDLLPDEENAPVFKIPKELMQNRDILDSSSAAPEKPVSPAPQKAAPAPADNPVPSSGSPAAAVPPSAASAEPPAQGAAPQSAAPDPSSSKTNESEHSERLFTLDTQPAVQTDDKMELGELPDMDSMLLNMQHPAGDVITNSDFANSGTTVTSDALKGADTEIMAKAIHTVLAQSQN